MSSASDRPNRFTYYPYGVYIDIGGNDSVFDPKQMKVNLDGNS